MSSTSTARAMVRLAAKDLRLGAVYLWAILPVYLGYGAALFVSTQAYYLVSGVFAFALMVGLVLLDTRYRGDLLLLSLPVTRRAVVLGRYLTAVVLLIGGAAACLGYARLLGALFPLGRPASTLDEMLRGIGAYAVAAALFVCVYFPLYYRLDAGKALYVLAAAMLGLLLVCVAAHALAWRAGRGTFTGYTPALTLRGVARLLSAPATGASPSPLLWIPGIAAALVVSALISVRAYARREV